MELVQFNHIRLMNRVEFIVFNLVKEYLHDFSMYRILEWKRFYF